LHGTAFPRAPVLVNRVGALGAVIFGVTMLRRRARRANLRLPSHSPPAPAPTGAQSKEACSSIQNRKLGELRFTLAHSWTCSRTHAQKLRAIVHLRPVGCSHSAGWLRREGG
jgi:hypothetical protein